MRDLDDELAQQSLEVIVGGRALLVGKGWDVAQSTLSRDLHELRLARVPTDEGMRYVATDHSGDAEQARAALESLLPQLFDRVDGVGELVVLHTVPGGAQPVAAAFDSAAWPDVLGTVAGDDTILVVCTEQAGGNAVAARLAALAGL